MLKFGISFGQFFSGEIIYKQYVIPARIGLNADSILDQLEADSSVYIITDKYYKNMSFRKGNLTYTYTYHDDTKRMYDQYKDLPYITFRDSRRSDAPTWTSAIYRDSMINILSYPCYLVEYVDMESRWRTYFSESIRIDYKQFNGHQVGGWYNKIKEVNGALDLKNVREYDDYTVITEAVSIKARKVNPNEFALPNDLMVVASEQALDVPVRLVPPSKESLDCFREKHDIAAVMNDLRDPYTVYISMIVTDRGEVQQIKPYEQDELRLSEIAMDIITNCGFKFIPGKLKGESVTSQLYFPVKFGGR